MSDEIEKLEDIVPQDPDFPKTMEFDGKRVGGAEHNVWIDEEKGIVYKIPGFLGLLWQEMDSGTINEDLRILQEHEIPVIPTKVHGERHVSYADEARNFYMFAFGGVVNATRRAIMKVYRNRKVERTRDFLAKQFAGPIQKFRVAYTKIVGWELIDSVAAFLNTDRLSIKTRDQLFDAARNRLSFVIRKRTKYVLAQPLLQPSHPMNYADIYSCAKYRELLFNCIQECEKMMANEDERRGLDLLGGKAFKFIPSALNPFKKEMYAEISNLLVADADIETKEDWEGFELEEAEEEKGGGGGYIVAKKGDVRLIDSGLYKLASKSGLLSKIKVSILRTIQEFQNGAIWAILGSFDEYKIPNDKFKTWPRKIAKWIVQKKAVSKMQAYAEAKRAEGESDSLVGG